MPAGAWLAACTRAALPLQGDKKETAMTIKTRFDHAGGRTVAVGDAHIYVEEAGRPDAPPLLCLHGGLGDMRDLNPVLPALAGRFRLIGMDFRGHGCSTLGNRPLTYALYQSDVQAVMRQLGITAARVLGFSDGGIVGYRLAATPNAGPSKEQSAGQTALFQVQQLATIGAQWRLAADDPALPMLQGLTQADWESMFPDALPYYRAHNPQPDFARLLAGVKALWTNTQPDNYPGETVRTITAPVLLIRGENDELCSEQELVDLLQHLPSHRKYLNILPNAGHAAHADQPETVAQWLTAFFTEGA